MPANIDPRIVGSGWRVTYPIRIGNASRGYKQFAVVGDAETVVPAKQVVVDQKSLNGTMWRHVFVADPATWQFPILVEDYTVTGLSEFSQHRDWLESIAVGGMHETYSLWDTGALGTYTAHTADNGTVYPISVLWLEIGDLAIRNHDTFLRDCQISLRKA